MLVLGQAFDFLLSRWSLSLLFVSAPSAAGQDTGVSTSCLVVLTVLIKRT